MAIADTSVSIATRTTRLYYLRVFRSAAFQTAALRAGFTSADLTFLGKQLLDWSKGGKLRLELNPLLGGFASPDRVTVGLRLTLMAVAGLGTPLKMAIAHELGHHLQEIQFGALTAEREATLTRADVLAFELGAEQIGHWTVGRELGWLGRVRAHLASWLH